MATPLTAHNRAGAIGTGIILAAALSACGGPAPADPPAVAPVTAPAPAGATDAAAVPAAVATQPASAAAAAPDPLGAAGGDIYVVDHVAMADQPCHVMDHSIMGQCTEADIERLRVEDAIVVNTAQMADAPCHTMGDTIMGQCTEDDVLRLAGEIRTAR